MNTEQLKLLLPLLKQFSEQLSAESCSDWELPNTPEGLALWAAINTHFDPADNDEWTLTDMSEPTLFMPDSVAIKYLIHCIEGDKITA